MSLVAQAINVQLPEPPVFLWLRTDVPVILGQIEKDTRGVRVSRNAGAPSSLIVWDLKGSALFPKATGLVLVAGGRFLLFLSGVVSTDSTITFDGTILINAASGDTTVRVQWGK